MEPVKPKTDVKKEDAPVDPKAERAEEVEKRAEAKVTAFKEKAASKKEISDDASTRLESAKKEANETFDDIKADKKTAEKVEKEVKKASEGWEKNTEKAKPEEGAKPLDKPDTEAVKREQAKERSATIAKMSGAVDKMNSAEAVKSKKAEEEF